MRGGFFQAPVLFSLDNEIYDGCVADVQYLVPGCSLTTKAGSGRQINHSNTAFVFYLYPTTCYRIAEIRRVKMPLMSTIRRKGATKNSLLRIFVQAFANSLPFPSRC